MAAEGRPFTGVLYAGLILTPDGPRVLEFNVRFGDPECQALLLRLDDDLLAVLASGARGSFDVRRLSFRKEVSACVVLASPGYPGKPEQGEWWQRMEACFDGAATFHDCDDATMFLDGGSDDVAA